ncbi:nucleotidyltransferase domain-containing protein [bacterium]|nr:nucleotidyltransferase domain-containing protein [bacterium]MBU1638261.1 nucleotidyltransferase domain-containing protein [bacterium]MBU1919798.1 nucleotidyltransferase domain-containing protein [bacterium]
MTHFDDIVKKRLKISEEQLAAYCRKWKIVEFSLFGSVLTDEFRSDSDVDVMVTFAQNAGWGLFDLGEMEDELSSLFGRTVDLVTKPSVERSENYIIRKNILKSSRTYYAA